MTRSTVAELLFLPESEELRFLPEGPTPRGVGSFSWVAIQHGPEGKTGSLNFYDIEAKTNQSFELPGRPGFAKPTTDQGVYVVGCEREIGLFNTQDRSWQVLAEGVDADVENTIINDGTIYANNIVFGTKDLEFATPKAGLYLFRGSDGAMLRLRADQICSNGKDVIDSGDGGRFLIDIDSPTKKVVRYPIDVSAGSLGEPELVVDLGDLEGVPDGMTMSPDEQSLIISFYNPNPAEFGETRQYSLYDGSLEHTWLTPGSPQATCPVLVELSNGEIKLVITTAVEHMVAERRAGAPNAGGIFIADTVFKSSSATPHFPPKKIAGLS